MVAAAMAVVLSTFAPGIAAASTPPDDIPPATADTTDPAPTEPPSTPPPTSDPVGSTEPPVDTNPPTVPPDTADPTAPPSEPSESEPAESEPAESEPEESTPEPSTSESLPAESLDDMMMTAALVAPPPPSCFIGYPVRAGSYLGSSCVESRLIQWGLTPGPVDNDFDATSVAALREFQTEQALPVTGVADQATLVSLGIWRSPAAATCALSVPVRMNSWLGSRCVESRLRQYGLISSVDDTFDWTSAFVIGQLQRNFGIPATSVADQAILSRLGIWRTPAAPTCTLSVQVRLGSWLGARCLETRLRQLGLVSNADDNFDWTSAFMIGQYQFNVGLPADSLAGPQTLSRLGVWKAPPAPTCSTSVPIRLDATAGSVCVETRLRQLGFTGATADGTFDWTSAFIIGQYQYNIGIRSDSVGDSWTLWYLGVWKHPPSATCGLVVEVSPGSKDGSACVEGRLRQLGLFNGAVDDYFDWDSYYALIAYQKAVGLPATGTADITTLRSLGLYNPAAASPLPFNSGSGRRIVYSRAQQRIWAVDENGNVVKTHRVSGRMYEPYAGTYYVYSRSMYTYSANNPSIRWRYMVRFAYGPQGGRIGFHEIPNRNGVPLQSAEQLGLPLSGGCVRQTTADALWVWNWAPVGTKVVVL